MKKRTHVLESACKGFEEDLVLYYYQDLPDADRGHLEEHVQECPRCGHFLDNLGKLLPQATSAKEELPPFFWPKYSAEVMEKIHVAQRPWWRNLIAPVRLWMLPALGTAAMAVLALGLVFGNGGWNSKPEAVATVPQELLVDAVNVEFFKSMDLLESLSVLEKMEASGRESMGTQQL
jgi:predicted anti-sigma-YlaC factor YlaD